MCVFVLRSEPTQPRRGACCGGAAYFGLSREASARGRAALNTALFVLREGAFVTVLSRWEQAKELTVFSPPSPHMFPFARAGASQRLPLGTLQAGSHPVQIRAEQQVSPTLLVRLRGGLGLRHPVVTSKKCHLPAPYHCTCSAGQEQQLTLCRYPMPKGQSRQPPSQDGAGLSFSCPT